MSEFEYERGREAGVKWGERLERERIIKLLKEQPNGIWQRFMLEQVIALIKGENK